VFVLDDPGGIFVLEDAAVGYRLDASMATGGGAGSGAQIFRNVVLSGACKIGQGKARGKNNTDSKG
jgi:hypothetical protein